MLLFNNSINFKFIFKNILHFPLKNIYMIYKNMIYNNMIYNNMIYNNMIYKNVIYKY